MDETARASLVSVTRGMANAMSRGKSIARMCGKCQMGVPAYPGRYPGKCPRCGGPLADPSQKSDEAVEIAEASPEKDLTPAERKKVSKLVKELRAKGKSFAEAERIARAKVRRAKAKRRRESVEEAARDWVKYAPGCSPGPDGLPIVCVSKLPRLQRLIEAGTEVKREREAASSRTVAVPYAQLEQVVPQGRKGMVHFLERTKDGLHFRCESPQDPVMIFEFTKGAVEVYATEEPAKVLGFDPREEMVEDGGWNRKDGWLPQDAEFRPERVEERVIGERSKACPSRQSTRRPRDPKKGAQRVHGPFRFRLRHNRKTKARSGEEIEQSLQNRRNARRGLGKRIQAAKDWHRSVKGQEFHKALGRYNKGNRRGESMAESLLEVAGKLAPLAREYGLSVRLLSNVYEHMVRKGLNPPVAESILRMLLNAFTGMGEAITEDALLEAARFALEEKEKKSAKDAFLSRTHAELKKKHPDWKEDQIKAVMLQKARDAGHDVGENPNESLAETYADANPGQATRPIPASLANLDPTPDDILDGLLRKLVLIESTDILQDVELGDDGSIYLFFDPSLTRREIDEVVQVMQAEHGTLQLVASPDQSLPGESVESDWWVTFLPGKTDEGMDAMPNPENYANEPDDEGEPPKQQTAVMAPPTNVDQLTLGLDVDKLLAGLGESAPMRWLGGNV